MFTGVISFKLEYPIKWLNKGLPCLQVSIECGCSN
uniref:Uncharacterized protein n=1 Tax=Arundo donax TaxID=35708 RepID=A0A0A9FX35_ARUDO